MPAKNDDDKFEFIPVDEDIAERRKDPEYMKLYEARLAELQREVRANKARRARRKAVVAWMRAVVAKVRGVWGNLTRGTGDEVL